MVIDISPSNLDSSCASSSPALRMMYSAYKLSKQGDNISPWCIPFPILNQIVVPYLFLTIASWPAYRFLKRQVRWSVIPISWRISHSLLWSTQTHKITVLLIPLGIFFTGLFLISRIGAVMVPNLISFLNLIFTDAQWRIGRLLSRHMAFNEEQNFMNHFFISLWSLESGWSYLEPW